MDIIEIKFKNIDNHIHNFYTSSPNHNLWEDNIKWGKYKDIFAPYISDFILQLTDNVKKIDLMMYLNYCKKGSFIAPHYDGEMINTSFMLLYCPKKYENFTAYTSYLTSEKYYQSFHKFEKLPLTKESWIDLEHERGKFYIVPTNLFHWVNTIKDDIDRITIMGSITLEFKS